MVMSGNKKFIKDLPIYINGFAVGCLFFDYSENTLFRLLMYFLSMISFFWYGKLLHKKESIKFIPKKYVIFNIDTFNKWFNDKDNNAVYSHSGVFLRTDKLSISQIKDYLIKCHGLTLSEWDIDEDVRNFYEEIRKDWMDKINK